MTGDISILNKAHTCAVTGHRNLADNCNIQTVKYDFKNIIDKGYDTFLIGMALGFDTACWKALYELKKEGYDGIRIIAVVPCIDQAKRFNIEDRKQYENMLDLSDYVFKEEREYFRNCMLLRNDFLLEHSSLLYAYYDGDKEGGTFYTVRRAMKLNIKTVHYGQTDNL